MTTRIIDHDATATSYRYSYTRTAEINGLAVRARIERGTYINSSGAIAEIRTDGMKWNTLTADGINNWWYDTPKPSPAVDAAAVLGPLAEQLLRGAAEILASPPTLPALSVHFPADLGRDDRLVDQNLGARVAAVLVLVDQCRNLSRS